MRPRTTDLSDDLSTATGAHCDKGVSALGDALCEGLRASRASAAASTLHQEVEYLSPILVDVGQSRRKLCATIERLCAPVVDIPVDQILARPSSA